MKSTSLMSAMSLLGSVVVICLASAGCVSNDSRSPYNSFVWVRGRAIDTDNRTLRLPDGSDLLTVIQRVREAGGFEHGIFGVTVTTTENGDVVVRIIDLEDVSLVEAERITFDGGTDIYIRERHF